MFEVKKIATLVACVAALAFAPAAFAQVAAGYAIQLGQTAGGARQMPHLDPRVGYGPQDWHAPDSSASSQNRRARHHQVRSSDNDDDDSAADSPDARTADWIQVK